ncbi:MAG TPA: trehalose-phosphatase [Mycobacteriales bacterium]|nr:trehalose-phosphatase [Mycobacteriales bacterium]
MADVIADLLADPGAALIALDFDGTLAPIVERPQDAQPAGGAIEALRRLAGVVGQVAVITGRPAEEVVRIAALDGVAGIRVLGHYGLQTWHDGRLDTPPADPRVELARQRLPELLALAPGGVYVEDKDHSVAVHTRPAASPQQALDDLVPALRALAAEVGLEAVSGRYTMELRPAGVDKGAALRDLVAEVGAKTVIYVGDDVGDLPAFRTIASLRETGEISGLAVVVVGGGTAEEVPADLRAAADFELPGPEAVVAWLAGLTAVLT